jgi:Zn-finger nucleic acid-binding protein
MRAPVMGIFFRIRGGPPCRPHRESVLCRTRVASARTHLSTGSRSIVNTMRCPADGGSLTRVRLDAALPAFQCESCSGHWLRFGDYLGWREHQPANVPEVPSAEPPTQSESRDSGVRRCPDCAALLTRYRIGHGVPFALDQCDRCNGIWLDGDEWEALRARGLHDDLNRVFGPGWQHQVRSEEERARTDAQFSRQLGEESFRRTREFAEWMAASEHRSEILAYLQWAAREIG